MKRRRFLTILATVLTALCVPWKWKASADSLQQDGKSEAGLREAKSVVLRVEDPAACSWDFGEGDYTKSINYNVVKAMIAAGLTGLTGVADEAEAWRAILPWKLGEKVVIKPNLGNVHVGYSKVTMTSPQVLTALVESLIAAGIPADAITVYDLTAPENELMRQWLGPLGIRTVFMKKNKGVLDRVASRLHLGAGAPDGGALVRMHHEVRSADGEDVECFMPKVLTEADHLINVSVLKGHQYLLQSCALKNHFGTVRFSNRNDYPVVLHGDHLESHIVDINADPHIRYKTRLCLVDALVGAGCFTRGDNDRCPKPWVSGGLAKVPCSLFFSRDPVALESVIGDLVAREQVANGFKPYSHQYLHDAAERGLGVHEHRDGKGHYLRINFAELMI